MTDPNDATNVALIRQGKLFPYDQSVPIYHCPGDQGVTIAGKVVHTVRSYSMNCFMGARDPQIGPIPSTAGANLPLFYAKGSDIPQPDQLWVVLDQDERSITEGFFVTDPNGSIWFDFPAMSAHRHSYSYVLNFADGHSEVWGYLDPRSYQVSVNQLEQPSNVDLARLARSTVRPNAILQ